MKQAVFLFISIVTSQVFFASPSIASTFEFDPSTTLTVQEAALKVEELLKNTKVVKKEIFCVKRELTCRTHYTLADLDGKVIDAFYVRFVAVDRSVGGNGYFFPVKGETSKYVRFEDFSYDGKVNIDAVVSNNVVEVEKTKTGSVSSIAGILTPRLGTTKVTNATITVSGRKTVLEGIMTDSADPTFSEKTKIEYLRTKVTR